MSSNTTVRTKLTVDREHSALIVFGAAVAMSVIGTAASMLRGARYVHTDEVVQREAVGVAS